MTPKDWKKVTQIRIEVVEKDMIWSFPIKIPRWAFNLLSKLEL